MHRLTRTMTAITVLITLGALLGGSSPLTVAQAANPGLTHELRVLFLGDNGHHKPYDRFSQLYPAMARRGVWIDYTDNPADLNAANLKRYDCLMVYANIDNLAPEQAEAVLQYVESGGGYAPIHCASYCFRNRPELVKLLGGQFQRHTTGTFRTDIIAPDHPIMKGFAGFESFDETYVHTLHNPEGRTVLSVRKGDPQGDGAEAGGEPYTWVRTQGKGRVFYTAWGHDERTWSNPGFIELVERGVRWASGDNEPAATVAAVTKAREALPAFKYTNQKVAYYPPGAGRGGDGEWNKMQLPLSPEDSMKHMVVPPGFEVKLFAAEPDIRTALTMAWDERGRLWLVESVDYPNARKPEGQGSDTIRICEDTDGDGKADKFTVFADKLSIPTSLTFANGGVIVHQAPNTLFLKDTDGDDKADVRQVLFSGWGTGDTHAGPNNLRYGPDNWIWGMLGYVGFDGDVGRDHHRFSMGFYRFKPDGSKLEYIRSTNNNTWGLGFSEEGVVFGSTANNNPSVYMPIADGYYDTVLGWRKETKLGGIANTARFMPITDRIRQVDVHGGYTAGAGHALYTARVFPKEYWNRTAFVNSPTGKLIGTFTIDPDGADYHSRNPANLVASDDEWTAPICTDVGPDGEVWFIDWYNYIVQHNPTPKGYETGPGNAYQTDLRDKTHCRIYRVVYTGSKPDAPIDLSKATPQQLVDTLRHPNMLWRMHAQRLLVERGKTDVAPALWKLVHDTSVDDIGLNVGAIHAINTLNGLGAIELDKLRDALHHPSAGVRRNAVAALPRSISSVEAILAATLLNDDDAQVRLATLLALADMPAYDPAGAAVYAMLQDKRNAEDRWIVDAATIAAARHDGGFIKAVLRGAPVKTTNAPDIAGNDNEQPKPSKNLLTNPSFEDVDKEGKPVGWEVRHYSGQAEHLLVSGGRTGKNAMMIRSNDGTDSSWFTAVKVKPRHHYRLSGWIKTDKVESTGGGLGALMNVHELQLGKGGPTNALKATNDWTQVSTEFDSGNNRQFTINLLMGGWGQMRGTIWWDDVELIDLGPSKDMEPIVGETGLSGAMDEVVRAVFTHHAMRGPTTTIAATLAATADADATLTAALIDALAKGWPKDTPPQLTAADREALTSLTKRLPVLQRKRLASLAHTWGHDELLAGLVNYDPSTDATSEVKFTGRVIELSVLKGQMKYDKPELKAKAGESLKIVFDNVDDMQHNFLLLAAGEADATGAIDTINKVGALADAMLTDPQGMAKHYIPDSPMVLAHTKLVDPHSKVELVFKAPAKPGRYPYICTFPGHWRIMRGVMIVE